MKLLDALEHDSAQDAELAVKKKGVPRGAHNKGQPRKARDKRLRLREPKQEQPAGQMPHYATVQPAVGTAGPSDKPWCSEDNPAIWDGEVDDD